MTHVTSHVVVCAELTLMLFRARYPRAPTPPSAGLLFHPSREIPGLVRENIHQCVADALAPLGISDPWNKLF